MDGAGSDSVKPSPPSQPQVLVINPKNALLFKGPSSQPATVNINLTNPATKWVAFKVKTTAPKRYCVRPNGGFIKAGDNVNVSIVYQPGEVNDAQERARHKFLVQAIFVENDAVQLEQAWKEVPKDRVMESKIRCVFEDSELGDGGGLVEKPHGQGLPHTSAGAGNSPDLDQSMQHIVQAATEKTSSVSGQLDLELRRMAEDYRRAQDEIANLRDENRRLREDSIRMKKTISSIGSGGKAAVSTGFGASSGSPQDFVAALKTDLTKVTTIVALVLAVLVGMIFSKLL
ncbi:putative Vesicle-associated membrane protein-associated protein A [Hypsibius exemplaris]|uniref:Vesicle-associated membrane protein-associated protein A n=1 Tax=Hypsibius exemplaris TaxID=2072580 RepID=A0A1W0WPY8_HYPEX|nr:putative Vesicle-associated membrane protein-associated protein A [Hypsibius exemplaris]